MRDKLKQIGFYFGRLKKERVFIAATVVVTVFAVLIQSFSLLHQPESANATGSSNDIIYGGCGQDINCIKNAYTNNTQGYQDFMNYFGIKLSDFNTCSWGSTMPYSWPYSFGRNNDTPGRNYSINVKGTTYYSGPLTMWGSTARQGFFCNSAQVGTFFILKECANLVVTKVPPRCPYDNNLSAGDSECKPPTPPTAKCNSLTVTPTIGTAGQTQFVFHIDGSLYNGALWTGYYMKYSKDGGAWTDGISSSLNPTGSGGAYNDGASWRVTFKDAGTYKVQGFLNTANAGNNITDVNTCVKTITVNPVPTPSYDLIKTVNKTLAKPGDVLTYTLTFKNTGNVDLTNAVIKDTLPAGLIYNDDAKATLTNANGVASLDKLFSTGTTVSSVKVGGSVVITFTVKVNSDSVTADKCGDNTKTFTNKSSATTSQKQTEDRTDNNDASTTVTVNKDCTYKYDLIKTVDKATAKPGETVTYTLTFKNTGNQPLTNAIVKDSLPAGLTYVKGSTTIDGKKASDGVTSANGLNIGAVAAGKTVVIKFQATMPAKDKLACGDTQFINKSSATTKENQSEDRTDNNDATTVVNRVCTPSFDLIKTVDKKTANPGDTIKYTLTFKNTGEVDLTNAVIKDALPTNLTYVADSLAIDGKTADEAGATGDLFGEDGLTIAKVEVGKTVVITFSAQIAAADNLDCGKTVLTNVAASGTSELPKEPDTSNNTAKTEVNKECKPAPKPCTTNPSISADDENCKPCEYNSSMNYDNPNCVAPKVPTVTPPTVTTTPTTVVTASTPTVYTPSEIVATGPVGTLAALIGAGAVTFTSIAYAVSWRAVRRG